MKSFVSSRSVLLALALVAIGLVACGSKSGAPAATDADETPPTSVTETTTDNTAPSQPDCTGGPVILETELLTQPLVVRESLNGSWYCTEFGGNTGDFGNIPEPTGVSDVQLTSASQGAVSSY